MTSTVQPGSCWSDCGISPGSPQILALSGVLLVGGILLALREPPLALRYRDPAVHGRSCIVR